MRKHSVVVLSLLVICSFGLVLSSCKEDEPSVPAQLSFSQTEMTVNEADGVIEIEIVLDKPAPEDIEITWELDGTALDKVSSSSNYDYEITSDYLETVIEKGETTGIIEIQLYSDLADEIDETIEIKIDDVDSDRIEITRDDEIEITIQQEDGLFIVLEWGVGEGEEYEDVDMDLFFWAETTSGELVATNYRTNNGSFYTNLNGSFSSPEYFFVPTAGFEDGTFGTSYNYYAGSVEEMNFKVSFIEYIDGEFEPEANRNSFTGTYTLDNINPWDDETNGTEPVLAQTFEKSGSTYSNFSSPIIINDTGSRTRGNSLKTAADFRKQRTINQAPLKRHEKN